MYGKQGIDTISGPSKRSERMNFFVECPLLRFESESILATIQFRYTLCFAFQILFEGNIGTFKEYQLLYPIVVHTNALPVIRVWKRNISRNLYQSLYRCLSTHDFHNQKKTPYML